MRFKSSLVICSTLTALSSTFVQAGGLEKSTSWSGRYVGIGGAATSSVEGSESLYFNPANLATTQGAEVSANFTGIFPQFSAPLASSNSVTGSRGFKPAFGAFASYAASQKLVVGIGAYAAGGAKATYNNVDFTSLGLPASFSPTIQANLSLIEYSVGAGYEIMDDLRIGLAWRVLHATATLGTINAAGAVTYNDLTATRFNGFRVGASYAPRGGRWGLGATWRSSIGVNTNGTSSGITTDGVATYPITGGPVSVTNTLPYQITLGGHYEILPAELKAFLQYDFTNYRVDQVFKVQGNVGMPISVGGGRRNLSDINQYWQNLNVIRVGTEYTGMKDVSVRLAYIYTSQTTPSNMPNPTYYAPGAGHTIVLGAGNHTWLRNMMLNAAVEYSFNSGNGPAALNPLVSGQYKENDYAFHLGATYQL